MKRIESLLKIAGMKFEFYNFKIRLHRRKVLFLVSFLVIKTVKCKVSFLVIKTVKCKG